MKSPRFLKEKLSQKKLDSASFDLEHLPTLTDANTEITELPVDEQVVTSQVKNVTPIASFFG